jgi:hypothetical protein
MDEGGGELRAGSRQGQVVRARPIVSCPRTGDASEGPEDPGRHTAHAPSITACLRETPKRLRALCRGQPLSQISGLRSHQGALGAPDAPHVPALASHPCVPAVCSTCLRPAVASRRPRHQLMSSDPAALRRVTWPGCTPQPRAHHHARVTSVRRLAHANDASVASTPRGLPQRRRCGLPVGETGPMHPHVFGGCVPSRCPTQPWLGQPDNQTPLGHPGGVGSRRPQPRVSVSGDMFIRPLAAPTSPLAI